MNNYSQFHYEIKLKTDNEYYDINYCSFIRCPPYLFSSFCLCKVFMSQADILTLTDNVSKGNFQKILLQIRIVDEISRMHDKEEKIVFNQKLSCIDINLSEPLNFSETNAYAVLFLVHPILLYMSQVNVYNVINENVTAYSALKNYEAWLNNTYGNVFTFKHFGVSINKNSHTYEQILIKTPNDISVPMYLINTYKINNNPSIYFFDNFNLSDIGENEITCQYLNLSGLELSLGQNKKNFPDSDVLTRIIKHRPISDRNRKCQKDSGNVFTLDSLEMRSNFKKITQSKVPKQDVEMEKLSVLKDRSAFVTKSNNSFMETISQSNYISNLYVPDDFDQAKARFDYTKTQFIESFSDFVIVEVTNAFPDYPNFGLKYDLERRKMFNFTPLSICNIFFRKSIKEHFMLLLNRSLMIKFREE